jgi:hypothetical protein
VPDNGPRHDDLIVRDSRNRAGEELRPLHRWSSISPWRIAGRCGSRGPRILGKAGAHAAHKQSKGQCQRCRCQRYLCSTESRRP